ncbi:MAG: GAF domain-containing protein [Planctomycetota bacterium]|nr:GAF domain-containing protein [Planctomycetota bacterium]
MQTPPFPPDEFERLAALRALDVLDTPSEERFDRITRLAKALFKVPIALISLVDSDRQWFKSRQGLLACETSREISFCGHAILEDKVLWVEDARLDKRFRDNPLVTGDLGIRFYAGYPIRTTGGQCIGTLCVIDNKPRPFSHGELAMLSDLGQMAGRELESFQVGTIRLELADRSVEERKHLIDGVSGLWNREGMLAILHESLADCARKKLPATIILVEVDIGAKATGIWSGAGRDQCVAEIAQVLRGSINSYDSIGRTRDEQFAVLLRGIPAQAASARVVELRKKLDENQVLDSIGVRLHIGHTCVPADHPSVDVEAELESARRALARERRAAAAAAARTTAPARM